MMPGIKPKGVWFRTCHRCKKTYWTIAKTSKYCQKHNHTKSKMVWEVPKEWIGKYSFDDIRLKLLKMHIIKSKRANLERIIKLKGCMEKHNKKCSIKKKKK